MEENKMNNFQLICIGGSAGSLQVILKILQHIKPGFPFSILLVIHRNMYAESALDELLSLRLNLQVKEIEDKDAIRAGFIHVCPADYHVLVEKNFTLSLDYSEKVHYSRPSIDVAFKSAADAYRKNVLAILLSGANADGADGLAHIYRLGGITMVQSPTDADVSYMPEQALKKTKAHYVLTANEIEAFLLHLASDIV